MPLLPTMSSLLPAPVCRVLLQLPASRCSTRRSCFITEEQYLTLSLHACRFPRFAGAPCFPAGRQQMTPSYDAIL